jgi:hypothetical protein
MAATTYNRAVSQYVGDATADIFIRDVSMWPKLIKRTDVPLTKLIGYSAAPSKPMHKVEWGISSPDPDSDTLATSINDSVTAVAPTNIGYYQKGMIIQMDSEQMYVSAVGASELTVTRGYAGTSAAAHVNTALLNGIRFLGLANTENAESPLGISTLGEVDYNYHQLFDVMVQHSHRADVTANYEIKGSRSAHEVKRKLEQTLPVYMENQLLWGNRAIGSTTAPSTMGGVFQTSFIYTRVAAASAPLTEYMFLEAVQDAYMAVGGNHVGKTVMCHPFYKRVLGSWYKDARRTTREDKKGGSVIDSIVTDFGEFKFVMNYKMTSIANPDLPDGRLLVFDPEDYKLRPYDSQSKWHVADVYEGGWYKRRAIRGDYTLLAPNPEKRVSITGLSTTAADYPQLLTV